MTTSRLLSSLFILQVSSIILSHAAPPPELTVLRQQYEKASTERVTTVHEAAVADLDAKFTTALDNAAAQAKSAGDLQTVLAIQADKKLLAEKQSLPADDDNTPESLKKLRAIYRDQLGKLTEQRTANASALLTPYTGKLKELEASLTKADRVDEAKAVFEYRETLKADAPPTLTKPEAGAVLSKGGILKGVGQFMFGNKAVDMTNAEGITDFVQVAVSHMGWIAIRANGNVHFQIQANAENKKAVWTEKRAVKVTASEGKPMFAIFEDGTGAIASQYADNGTFPPDRTNLVDIDATAGVYVFLHRDHTVSFAGNKYDELVAQKFFPAASDLKNVAAINCSRYDLFVLFRDGSVKAWSTKTGELELPRTVRKNVAAIAAGTSRDFFSAISDRDKPLVWNDTNLPAKAFEAAEVRCGGEAAVFKGKDGEWKLPKEHKDANWLKMLGTLLPNRKLIDMDVHCFDNSEDNKNKSQIIMWIEAQP